jgi:hypothetical protein
VRQAIHRALSVAVKDLLFGEICCDEYGAMVTLSVVEYLVETFALLAIVIHHCFYTQLVNYRIRGLKEIV